MTSALRSLAGRCLFASVLTSGVALLPVPARACSYGLLLVEASYPKQGQVDVPTNAVLFIYGRDVSFGNETRLIDTMTGASVELEPHSAPSGLDLLPLEPLAPNRTYQLVVSPPESSVSRYGGDDVVEFTTGSAAAEALPAPSAPKVDALVVGYDAGSCGKLSELCLGLADHPGLTLEARVGDELLYGSGAPWGLSRIYGGEIGETECINLRFRDALGRRSLPTVVCGTDIRRVELENPDFTEEVSCENYTKFIKSTDEGDDLLLPPDVSATEPDPVSGQPLVSSTGGDDARDSVDLSPPAARASSGCAMTPGSGGWSLAGLGLALAACLSARRRSRR